MNIIPGCMMKMGCPLFKVKLMDIIITQKGWEISLSQQLTEPIRYYHETRILKNGLESPGKII